MACGAWRYGTGESGSFSWRGTGSASSRFTMPLESGSPSIVAVAGRLMRAEHAVSLERLGEHQQTFSAVYDTEGPWNERQYIEKVIERTGAAGNYVYPTGERLWAELEKLVWHQDEPF